MKKPQSWRKSMTNFNTHACIHNTLLWAGSKPTTFVVINIWFHRRDVQPSYRDNNVQNLSSHFVDSTKRKST